MTLRPGGLQQSVTLCENNVQVTDGTFTVVLDFGGVFAGSQRFLEIDVRADTGLNCTNASGFTLLAPRQNLTTTPYAVYSSLSGVANNSSTLNGFPSSFFTNAGNLSAGTLPLARLGPSVVQTNINNTFSGSNSFSGPNNFTGANTFSNAGNVFVGNGAALTGLWRLGGNAGTNPATDFVGTTDNVGFTIRVNNTPFVRITPGPTDTGSIVNGATNNTAGAFQGATISGGGSTFPMDERQQVTGDFGTIAGGLGNTAGSSAFVGGGFLNRAGSWAATAGGSENWAVGNYGAVAGGQMNRIISNDLDPAPAFSAISGGQSNTVEGSHSFIGGGQSNSVGDDSSHGSILGGSFNQTFSNFATVAGGSSNTAGGAYSFAAGRQAKVRTPTQTVDIDGDEGTFVWADSAAANFQSTGPNQFLIRASGGVGIGTNAPSYPVHIAGTNARVMYVENASTAGSVAAVRGTITSTSPGTFSAGVRGENLGTGGSGVGLYGTHAGSGWGVYGSAPLAGYAAYFNGRVNVTDAFSAASKAFRIDHPQDPMNKELWHSCVESPDMMNIYNGNVVTDDAGYATISLPAYFEALNKEFKYQLTVIDTNPDAWIMAKVTREVSDNSFEIRTSSPATKVSWQVTGVRKDAFAEKFRIVPEVMKPDDKKGTYLNPEAFGQVRVIEEVQ